MFRFLIAVVCFTSLAQAAPKPRTYGVPTLDGRIVGGDPTVIEEYPYQASLQYYSSHICGAVVISEQYVVTAGHCTDGYDRIANRFFQTFSNNTITGSMPLN